MTNEEAAYEAGYNRGFLEGYDQALEDIEEAKRKRRAEDRKRIQEIVRLGSVNVEEIRRNIRRKRY